MFMKKSLMLATIVAGFSSIIMQIVVLREVIAGFYGNELILGIILGNWLLLTGIGAYLGKYFFVKKNLIRYFIFTQILIGIFSVITIFLIRVIRSFIAVPGEIIGIIPVFFYSLLMLAPVTILHGMQFVLMSKIVTKEKNQSKLVGKVYVFDNIGDLIGGLLFSYVLVVFFNSFEVIYFILFLNFISAYIICRVFKEKIISFFIIILSIFFILLFSFFNLDNFSTQLQYPSKNIIFNENSLYGNVIITELEGQLEFYENGYPLFTTLNTFSNEETVHYGLSQVSELENVLVISGGVSGTLSEILKYKDVRIDYVELDPLIIKASKLFTNELDDDRINVHTLDGRLFFLKKTDRMYDAIIIDLPDPSSIQINRFYTLDFFKDLKDRLDSDGVVSLSLGGSENFLSEEKLQMNGVLFNTLNQVFKNVIIVPGDTNYYVASDVNLDFNFKEKLLEKNITTEYIQYYVDAKITESRISEINNVKKINTEVNTDLKPVSNYLYLNYWLELFNLNTFLIIGFVIGLVILFLFLTKGQGVPLSIFVIGFSATAIELLIIIVFQIVYGYVYHQIGIIISMFMVGLVVGAILSNNYFVSSIKTKKSLVSVNLVLVVYSILFPFVIYYLKEINDTFILFITAQILIPILAIILGFIVGIAFPIALKLYVKKDVKNVGLLYGIDLAGACIGAYITGVLLIPVFGVITVCYIVGSVNLLVIFWLLISKN